MKDPNKITNIYAKSLIFIILQYLNFNKNTVVMGEIWKDVKEFDGWYQVSNKGRVRSWKNNASNRRKSPKVLQPQEQRGYKRMRWSHNGDNGFRSIHRLVAKAFIPNPENKKEVNHKDGDKTNNNVENLEWVTAKENCEHASKNGLYNASKGVDHYSTNLTAKDVKNIRKVADNRGYFYGSKELAEKYNVAESTIKGIVQRRKWKHI